MEKIQSILFYAQIADLFVKLFVFVAILVALIVLIKYFIQKTKHEKALFEKEMNKKECTNVIVESHSSSVNDDASNEETE